MFLMIMQESRYFTFPVQQNSLQTEPGRWPLLSSSSVLECHFAARWTLVSLEFLLTGLPIASVFSSYFEWDRHLDVVVQTVGRVHSHLKWSVLNRQSSFGGWANFLVCRLEPTSQLFQHLLGFCEGSHLNLVLSFGYRWYILVPNSNPSWFCLCTSQANY